MRSVKTYKTYYDDFIHSISPKAAEKVEHSLFVLKVVQRASTKFVKHIKDGVYEVRAELGSDIYRVFFIFDEGNIVVLFNGCTKKTQKTPPSEIDKALCIKKEYMKDKVAGTLELENL